MKFKHIILSAIVSAIAAGAFTACDDRLFLQPVGIEQTSEMPVDNINANIASLRKFVEAKETGATVVNISPLSGDGGCTLEFSDGNTVTLKTKIGSLPEGTGASETPYTPAVAAAPDENGVYCWTVDGEWLKASDGSRIEVTGARAVTPRVLIDEAGRWSIDTDIYGKTPLGTAAPGEQKSAIASVDCSDPSNVVVSFNGGAEPIVLSAGNGGDNPDTPPVMGDLRRQLSPEQPMWMIHIDSWNYPDPHKIIDLIPEDIRPYCVFNLSLSVSHDETTGRFKVSEYGYEIVKSWIRVCAERNVWAMIQPSSGGFSHFPDVTSYDQFGDDRFKMYREFFEEYPNFLGFNYCEQFWGFAEKDALGSPTWFQRVAHWNELLKLTHEYGGYLTVSFCANYWSAPINPVAMVKRNPEFAATLAKYPENFIMCEKYTQEGCFFDVEAECMGVWLSGHAGNYGIRFDQCAWNKWASKYYFGKEDQEFPVALGAALQLEHITLTGQTVIDGPELIWCQDFTEGGIVGQSDGYQSRSWTTFSQFRNINIDLFRKILDGTIRIMSKREVLDRTKIAIIQDVTTGQEIERYCLPKWFHEGAGALSHDGGREDNHFYLRASGRYPAIPVIAQFAGSSANDFKYKYTQSSINSTWADKSTKLRELNRVFPSEYSGELFAGRYDNAWVTYNPYNTVKSALIPLKYNTCESIGLDLETFTTGVWKEYPDRLTCYLTNYSTSGAKVKSVIRVNGASARPTVSVQPRAEASVKHNVTWEEGVCTITIEHNGPLDLSIGCSGSATDRLTDYKTAALAVPQSPQLYYGPRQTEAEVWDFKNIGARYGSGYDKDIRNYTGQGYIKLSTRANAAVRDEVSVINPGPYLVKFRYRAETADVKTVDLYINGQKVASPVFSQSGPDKGVWNVCATQINLRAGSNIIELKANAVASCDLYLDNLVVESAKSASIRRK